MDFYSSMYTKAMLLVLNVGLKPHLNIQVAWGNWCIWAIVSGFEVGMLIDFHGSTMLLMGLF